MSSDEMPADEAHRGLTNHFIDLFNLAAQEGVPMELISSACLAAAAAYNAHYARLCLGTVDQSHIDILAEQYRRRVRDFLASTDRPMTH